MACLAALTMLVFIRHLFAHWTFPWDFVGAYTATPPFVASTIGSGHFLSWSPFVASGLPVDVNPQAGLYYPVWWLFGGLGVPLTLGMLTKIQIAHVLFGSTGVLALCRARRLEWPWPVIAGAAYVFFGAFYGEAEHADIIRGFAYLPWLFWALTPPDDNARWIRLAALPPLIWLIATGAYPAQLVSFALTGSLYVIVALRTSGPDAWRRHHAALLLASGAAAAACVAVLYPYLRADSAHELFRAAQPTVATRAGESLSPLDLLGLYLNNYAWTYDGSVTAWAVGVPTLIGLACVRLNVLRRHAPLLAAGTLALVLAVTPRIGFIGRAMVAAGPLFPSRFPAADYKAVVVLAIVVLSAEAWREIAARPERPRSRALLAGCALAIGALLAPSTYAQPTRALWLLIASIVACVVLVIVRPTPRLLAFMLVGVVAIDGAREARDYRLLGRISSWQAPPALVAPYLARDRYVRQLPALLRRSPASRPARVPPYLSLTSAPTGSDPDANGWVADGYHLIDYGGTIERVLRQAEHDPSWTSLLLAPWHAYVFPCAAVGCANGTVHLPAPSTWRASPEVLTRSYGPNGILYDAQVSEPMLMVENELAQRGWRANASQVRIVNAGIPLRAWRLSPGHYQFTATYHESGRGLQEAAVIAAMLAWLGCALALRRRRAYAGEPARATSDRNESYSRM